MSARAIDVIVDALRDHERHVAPRGTDKYQAQCPSHDDQNPPLSIAARQDGKGVVLTCHAGCDYRDVLAAVGLSPRDLYDDPDMRNVYRPNLDYKYARGGVKHRRQAAGSRTKKLWRDRDKPDDSLYRAEKLHPDDAVVYLTEGEKACDAIWAMDGVAVSTGGSTRRCDMSPLRGRHVIGIVDRDEAGRKWAMKQRDSLAGVAGSLQLMQSAVPLDKADVVEHFDHDMTLAELVPYYLDDPYYLDNFPMPGQPPADDRDSDDETPPEPDPEPADVEFMTTCLADVTPEPVRWLWRDRLPLGKLIVLDGDPSTGKSTLTLFFTSVITTGGTWPDDTACEYSGPVVLLTAEDSLADTIRPRLDAAGACVTEVHAVNGVPIGDGAVRMPDLNDIGPLRRLVDRTHARLVVVDVLMAFVPTGHDAHRDQDIRHVLGRLAAMAEQTECTVLLLRHLNKGTGRDPMYRGGGSIGIIGAARGGLLLARDPEDHTVRILAASKASNLAATEPPSLRFRITDTPIGPGINVGKIDWLGTSDYTARDLLAAAGGDDIPTGTSVEECERWLTDYLKHGDKRGAMVKATAQDAGFKERTVQRAAKNLGVEYKPQGYPRETWWSLPHSRANPENQNPAGATGATGGDQDKQPENPPPEGTVAPNTRVGATGATEPKIEFADMVGTFGGETTNGEGPQTAFVPPKGPARCDECGFHIETQGHRDDCSAANT